MSEDVSKFLLQVKELGDRRIEEDEARSRELEEKILRERKERQARREERARSISPQKSSPANTPSPATNRMSVQITERLNLDSSPILDPPTHSQSGPSPLNEEMAARGVFSTSPTKENEFPFDAENKSANPITPTKTGPMARGLSWQKRPNSQASDSSRSRPLSMLAAENAARTTTPSEPASATSAAETASKDQIASALSSKDPSWFRQTADRGATSAAYRRSQVEDAPTADMSTLRTQLPGMSRMGSQESSKDETSSFPELPTPTKLTSPGALANTPKLAPPGGDAQLEIDTNPEKHGPTSPSPTRTSPTRTDRPVSPTKGVGGFVQSAMMKRSDSVSKRWSVSSPSLPRRNSAASSQGGWDPSNRASVIGRSRPTSMIREPSKEPSRPTSSHQKEDLAHLLGDDPFKTDTATSPEPSEHALGEMTPPTSPSKTMDPRRWSPTKASWLESALNKPESPKSKPTTPGSNQPAWMAEIQKAKAQKAANPTGERPRSKTVSHKHQVSIGGLMRSTAPGVTATPPPTGLGGVQSPPPSIGSITRSPFTNPPKEPQDPVPATDTATAPPKPIEKKPIELPSTMKPKTDAPAKKEFDFRGNLKPRHNPGSSTDVGSKDNELKNVFGNLRKTTTQNYVAPDELKDNILRGKAALAVTGGPKVSERKDEFKEAILAKKKEFQQVQSEGRGISRNDSNASEKPIPEGLVKRFELGRSNTFKKDLESSDAPETDPKVSRTASTRDAVPGPPTSLSDRFANLGKPGAIPDIIAPKQDRPFGHAKRASIFEKQVAAASSTPAAEKETPAPGRLPGKLGGNALANRFNPALAGLLARGPPGMAPGSSAGGSPSSSQSSSTEANDSAAGSGPKLTHMTKGRARGPKRSAPTSTTAAAAAPAPVSEQRVQEQVIDTKPIFEKPSTPEKKQEPLATVLKPSVASPPESPKKELDEPHKPQVVTRVSSPLQPLATSINSPVTKEPKSPSKVHEQVAAFAAQSRARSPTKTSDDAPESTSQPPSPRKLDMRRMSKFLDDSTQIVAKSPEPEKHKIELPGLKSKNSFDKPSSPELKERSPAPSPTLNRSGRPLPEPLSLSHRPFSKDGSKSDAPTPETRSTPLFGARPLPVAPTSSGTEPSRSPTRALPKEPEQAPAPISTPAPASPPPPTSPQRSPTKDASSMLSDFFGSERPTRKYGVDAAELLMNKPITAPPKIQTLSVQLFQFSADGKKQPVPAHHERVLFEREMYLCPHTFSNEQGKKITEVYFWAGDEVPASTVEDASVFVAREARALGGRLVKLQQGKETAEFLQALGGTVITQRGSGNKYDSLAPHMLCGRRYLGHVVFDEVDFTPSVLCSGFPYIISQAGKCYLWKGKGCGVDELGCARLIGMDYALSGEMQEVEDGHEPASFWELFMGGSRYTSADHWRLKPNYDKYCCRLFSSDADSKQQIVEISPFSQADLRPTGVYVVDAFFELYIVVGARAQNQYASFHNALDFAQEYAILAAGMEDRPFVPISTVVMEGIPRDLKSVFRKWRDAQSPTIMHNTNNTGGGLKRGRSLKIVSLNQALQALSD